MGAHAAVEVAQQGRDHRDCCYCCRLVIRVEDEESMASEVEVGVGYPFDRFAKMSAV